MLTFLYQTGTEFLTFYFFNINTELSTFHQQKFRVFNKKHKKLLEVKLNSLNVIVPIFLKGSNIMSEFKELLNEQLQDETFKKEWEDIQPELDVIRAMVNARISQNLTQKELAKRTGINQADISKLENGTRNPSLKLLKRLAAGMGMALKIEFIPLPKKEI